MRKKIVWMTAVLCLLGMQAPLLHAQSISEKKAAMSTGETDLDQDTEQFLLRVNEDTQVLHKRIETLYEEVFQLYEDNADPACFQALLKEINENKRHLRSLENSWREVVTRTNRLEGYGLWHAPETTLEQIIIDYGSQDYVYLIPPEVGSIKLSIDSNLPIPRASWSEMIELILKQNGVGIKVLNPYLRQLYLVKQTNSNVRMITNKRQDLEVYPGETRVAFVLSPESSDVRRTFAFLERFVDPHNTTLYMLGRDIIVIGQVSDVQDLLKLYDFVSTSRGDKEFRLVPVYKVKADEMARILGAMFDHSGENKGAPPPPTPEGGAPRQAFLAPDANGLKIIPLEGQAQALFIVGTKDEVRKAEEVVRSVEAQIGGARDRVVFWYTVKHSDPEELADVLEKVYSLMITTGAGFYPQGGPPQGGPPGDNQNQTDVVVVQPPQPVVPIPPIHQRQPPPTLYGQEGFYQEGNFVVNPVPVQPGRRLEEREPNQGRQNFIVDLKTGSIVMVVESDTLPKLKDLLKRLDVPKKMVQIEVLLFEKRLSNNNQFGLNMLRVGDLIEHVGNGASFTGGTGIFDFFVSRTSNGKAFDLIYRFLLSQDDVQINSSPSVLAVNQTPAQISIVEDISINTGVFEVETAKGVTLKDAFTRAQYGITIDITPTIHLRDEECDDEDYDYVSLDTEIIFDTIQPGAERDRPNVTRRNINNQVLIPDGQTVILGGLRRKISSDSRRCIPFIGELPGIGKLFSDTRMSDDNTEMFIMMTPHIVVDPRSELQCLRQELLCRRPGDVPYFLECVETAHTIEKNRLMSGSLTILLGRPGPVYYCPDFCSEREYDGR